MDKVFFWLNLMKFENFLKVTELFSCINQFCGSTNQILPTNEFC